MYAAAIIFAASLVLIVALFALKYWEMRRQRTAFAGLRARADRRALEIKALLLRSGEEAQRIPPTLLYLSRIAVHESALGLALLARVLERQAHNVADMMSHKHRFERREPQNEFLKQVGEYKNGSPESTDDSGQNA